MANALAVANIQGPTVAKNTARIDKKLAAIEDEITTYRKSIAKTPTDENKAYLIILENERQRIINQNKTGYGSSAGTGATNDPVNIR
jgi:hypothetical protein